MPFINIFYYDYDYDCYCDSSTWCNSNRWRDIPVFINDILRRTLSFSFIFECYSMWFKGFCFSKLYFTYSICIFICSHSPVRRVDQSLPTASANICMMYRKILHTLKTLFCTKQQPLQLKIQTNYNTNECSFSGGRSQFYLYNTKSQQQS